MCRAASATPSLIVTRELFMWMQFKQIDIWKWKKDSGCRGRGVIRLWVYSQRRGWWKLWITAPSTRVKACPRSTRAGPWWENLSCLGWGGKPVDGPGVKSSVPVSTAHSQAPKWKKKNPKKQSRQLHAHFFSLLFCFFFCPRTQCIGLYN